MKRFLSLLLVALFLTLSAPMPTGAVAAADNTDVPVAPEVSVTRVEEVDGFRQPNSETFLLSDGTYECVVYAENKYYWDSVGNLQLIDNTLIPVSASRADSPYKNTGNEFDVRFSGTGMPTVGLTYRDHGVTFSPVSDSRKSTPISVGNVTNCSTLNMLTSTGKNTAKYENVFGTADLVYVLTNSSLKEYIILEDSAAPSTYAFTVTLDNLTMEQTGNSILLKDEKNEPVFSLGGLFAVDAAGEMTEDVTYTVSSGASKGTFVMTVALDSAYLQDPDRQFPVVVDPSVMISSSQTADASVCSAYPDNNYYLSTKLWTGRNDGYGIRRSYLRFTIPTTIPTGSVTSATLDLEYAAGVTPTVRAYKALQSWASSTITWNNKPSVFALPTTVGSLRSGSSTWYSINVTTYVKNWNNGEVNYGFEVRDTNETDATHWTNFYSSDEASPHKPELHIYYDALVVDRMKSEYTNSYPYRDDLVYDMNCYGYALHIYAEKNPGIVRYIQMPGEFSPSTGSYTQLHTNIGNMFENGMSNPEGVMDYLESLIYADFAAFNNSGSEWVIIESSANEVVPSGWRKIAFVISLERKDYHFYVRHSSGTWSHKEGSQPPTNLSKDSRVPITDTNIALAVTEGTYDDGVRYYLIKKPFIVDYPHGSYKESTINTPYYFSDRAGDSIDKSNTISEGDQLGRIDYSGDNDYFSFIPTATGLYCISVSVTSVPEADTDMVVYDTYGNLILQNLDGEMPIININMTAGSRYFIRIFDAGTESYSYELSIARK